MQIKFYLKHKNIIFKINYFPGNISQKYKMWITKLISINDKDLKLEKIYKLRLTINKKY